MTNTPLAVYMQDETKMLKLAREIAIDIMPFEEILKNNGLSVQDYERISRIPLFGKVVAEYRQEWNSALSTRKRIEIKAQTLVEAFLPTLADHMFDPHVGVAAKVEAGKYVARLAGINERGEAAPQGERFTININMGDDHKLKIEKDATPMVIENDLT